MLELSMKELMARSAADREAYFKLIRDEITKEGKDPDHIPEVKRLSQEYTLDYYRKIIEADGLDVVTNVRIGIKLKRNEKLYYIGGDNDEKKKLKINLIASNQRLFFIPDNNKIYPIRDSSELLFIKEGLVSKPLSSIISIDPPFPSEDYYSWHMRLHFDNGKDMFLKLRDLNRVDSLKMGRMFYTILSELIDRVNDPIQEKCLSPERQRIADEVKIAVWRRDGGSCVKCGSRENLEFDHMIPVSKGGGNTTRNIELLCEKCNRKKSTNI